MGLKRKRSSADLSHISPCSASTWTSSPPCSHPTSPSRSAFSFGLMAVDAPVPAAAPPAAASSPWWAGDDLASRLASRTRKRHRDNRPDDEAVHRTCPPTPGPRR